MPRQARDRLLQHNEQTGPIMGAFGKAGRAFAVSNLALSPKHVVGESFEIGQRLAVE